MSSNQTPYVHKKKKPKYNAEIVFRDHSHMLAYLVDKIATNRNKKFNMKLIT